MAGTYHLIHHNANYASRRVRCQEGGQYHRHKTHLEESVRSVCGKTLVRNRDKFCNVGIAEPSWDKDWCHDCVRAFPWTEQARKLWLGIHGIETHDNDAWEEWLRTPDGKAVWPGLAESVSAEADTSAA